MIGRIALQITGWLVFALLLIVFPLHAEKPCLSVSSTQTNEVFGLKVANTFASRETDLQNRLSLSKRGRMFFVFSENAPHVFWIKNTLLELDFLFLNDKGIVQNLVTHIQPGTIKIYGFAR